MTVNEGLPTGSCFQHCRISSYLGKRVAGVCYLFIKRTGWDRNEAYMSSEHIFGWSILYPALRTPKRFWLVMLGYGVSPRYKGRRRPKKKVSSWWSGSMSFRAPEVFNSEVLNTSLLSFLLATFLIGITDSNSFVMLIHMQLVRP